MVALIVREEIVCTIVLTFMLLFNLIYNVQGNDTSFTRMSILGLGHVVLDMITAITVNNMEYIPAFVNKGLHLLFYFFGIAFIMEFYNYVIRLTVAHKYIAKLRLIGYLPLVVFLVLSIILPIEYISGKGTYYSYGPLVFAGYITFAVYCAVSMIIVLINRNKVETKIKLSVIPMIIIMTIMVGVQAIIPELLMTGAGITLVCLGLFVVLDNPAKKYMEQAYWDSATGIKNKNGYKKDLEYIKTKYLSKKRKARIGFILGDMNGLKVINDNYGHAEGDKMLTAAAMAMRSNLKKAYNIYRTGGDEFVAIYINPDDNDVKLEIEETQKACEKYTDGPIMLSIALGYASGDDTENIDDIYEKADSLMYINKTEIKKNHPELNGR